VVGGLGAVEVVERRLVLAAVVEDVAEVDARLDVVVVELQRAAQRRDRRVVVPEPVLRVADEGDRLGTLRGLLDGDVEEALGLLDQPLAEEGAADLQHEIDVVLVAELEHPAKAAQRGLLLPELQERLAESRERVLVLPIQDERLLEGAPRPRELVARQARVSDPDVQLHRVRVERESLTKYGQRLVVQPLVVELVRAFVVLFGTHE
jgi:hypothetical protein